MERIEDTTPLMIRIAELQYENDKLIQKVQQLHEENYSWLLNFIKTTKQSYGLQINPTSSKKYYY
jgi:hypothetical protein